MTSYTKKYCRDIHKEAYVSEILGVLEVAAFLWGLYVVLYTIRIIKLKRHDFF